MHNSLFLVFLLFYNFISWSLCNGASLLLELSAATSYANDPFGTGSIVNATSE